MCNDCYCQETKESRSRLTSDTSAQDEGATVHESQGADYGSGGQQQIFI